MRVTIYGLGHVGSAVAFGCIKGHITTHSVNQLDLIDTDGKKLFAEYNDFIQGAEILRDKIDICTPITARESDVYVISAGTGLCRHKNYNRALLLAENSKIVMPIIKEIKEVRHENSLVLMVTNPSTMLSQHALNEIPLVFPIGTMLDNARLRLTKVEGSHEKPDIQKKFTVVKEGKGHTNWACACEVLTRIGQWGRALW